MSAATKKKKKKKKKWGEEQIFFFLLIKHFHRTGFTAIGITVSYTQGRFCGLLY